MQRCRFPFQQRAVRRKRQIVNIRNCRKLADELLQVSAEELGQLNQLIAAAQIETQESLLALMPSDQEVNAYQKQRATLDQGSATTRP